MAFLQFISFLILGYFCQKGLTSQIKNNVVSETTVCHAAGETESDVILNCENGLINVKTVKYGFRTQKIIDNHDYCHFDSSNVCWEKRSRMHSVDYSSSSSIRQSFMNIQMKKSGAFSTKPIICSNDIEINSVEITYQCLPMESIACMGSQTEMMNSEAGYIKSPNYPLLYPSSYESSCHLEARGSTLFLYAEDFQLEDSDLCFRDSLKVYGHKRILETDYCGKIASRTPLIVTQGELTVEFSSDDFVGARGFLLKFWALNSNLEKVPVKTICSKSSTNGKTDSGVLVMDDVNNDVKVMPIIVEDNSVLASIVGSAVCAVLVVVILIAVAMRVLRKQNKINSDTMRKGPIMTLPGEETGIYVIQRGAKIGDQNKQHIRNNMI